MKKYFRLIFALFIYGLYFAPELAAQNDAAMFNAAKPGGDVASLSGVVTDQESKGALIGAAVTIPDLKVGAVTDVDGKYQFDQLPTGAFVVVVSYIGYKSFSQTVNINGASKADFVLTVTPIEQSEVVVTGLSKATQIKRSPVPILSVKREYLESHVASNAIDAISAIPGVSAVSTGPNVSKPFIRGLGYNRILTLYDGVRQEGQQWGDEHGVEIDQYGVDHVEVIKGPASLSFGSDALAGVVNFIPVQPPADGKTIFHYLTEYQTNNRSWGSSFMGAGNNKGIEWMARLSTKSATNYQNKYDGRVYGTAFHETDGEASIGLHRNWGYSHLNLVAYNNEQLIPDGSRDSATRKFTVQTLDNDSVRTIAPDDLLRSTSVDDILNHPHQHIQHYRAFLNNNFILGDGLLTANIGYQRSVRQEFSFPEHITLPGLYLQLNTYSYDFKYAFPQIRQWDVLLGVNGMYQNNTVTNGQEFIIPSYRQFDVGPFVLLKRSFGDLDVAGGVRYDMRTFNNDALYTERLKYSGLNVPVTDTAGAEYHFSKNEHTYSGVSGSLGLTYNFSPAFSLKANISRGYRAPNVIEITANGVHPGTNTYQIGNPNFQPEFSLQEDVGAAYSSKYFSGSLSVFNNNIDHYIYNQKLTGRDGSDSVVVAGNQTFQFQQGGAHLYGGELSVDLHPISSIHFENSLSVVYGNLSNQIEGVGGDSARYLPFIPPFHGTSELRYTRAYNSGKVSNFYIYGQLAYYAAQNRAFLAYNTETPTPGYTLTNVGVGVTFNGKKGGRATASILVSNLFDVAYQNHLSRLKYFEPYPNNFTGRNGIYSMGRNINFKVNIQLEREKKKSAQ